MKLHNDRRGGIEGLPMELLLIIVIATVGTAVILSWLGNVSDMEPKSYGDVGSDVAVVSTNGNYYFINQSTEGKTDFSVTVHANNNKGDGISGAVVRIIGLNVSSEKSTYGITASDGTFTFEKLTIGSYIPGGMGYLTVIVDSDLGNKEFRIPVVMT